MRNRAIPFIILVAILFIVLYSSRDTPESEPETTSESLSKGQLDNLLKYKERFERNNYHFEKALSALNDVELTLDTLDANLSEDELIELKILRNRSSFHLEKLIDILKEYEEYPNLEEKNILEKAIAELEQIDLEVLADSLKSKDIFKAFEYSLNALAKAEIKVSESAAKTNQKDLAILALKQAQAHVKNALLLDHSIRYTNGENYDMEMDVFLELDSLIENRSVSIRELDSKLTQITKELDQLLDQKVVGN